jgi:hypothetical protein
MEDREGGKIALKWIVEKYVKFWGLKMGGTGLWLWALAGGGIIGFEPSVSIIINLLVCENMSHFLKEIDIDVSGICNK